MRIIIINAAQLRLRHLPPHDSGTKTRFRRSLYKQPIENTGFESHPANAAPQHGHMGVNLTERQNPLMESSFIWITAYSQKSHECAL